MNLMPITKTHPKGQVVIPKAMRDQLGIKPGKMLSIERVGDHIEIRPLPDDPIEYLTGIFQDQPGSMATELLDEREKDDAIEEARSL
jgi:AbrB family looped-hinge helix DNA binding protein